MCEKPFVIRQLDSIPISQSALQHGAPAELPATSPGKRKMQDEDVHQSHENSKSDHFIGTLHNVFFLTCCSLLCGNYSQRHKIILSTESNL